VLVTEKVTNALTPCEITIIFYVDNKHEQEQKLITQLLNYDLLKTVLQIAEKT
jgi:hypothetical protein